MLCMQQHRLAAPTCVDNRHATPPPRAPAAQTTRPLSHAHSLGSRGFLASDLACRWASLLKRAGSFIRCSCASSASGVRPVTWLGLGLGLGVRVRVGGEGSGSGRLGCTAWAHGHRHTGVWVAGLQPAPPCDLGRERPSSARPDCPQSSTHRSHRPLSSTHPSALRSAACLPTVLWGVRCGLAPRQSSRTR